LSQNFKVKWVLVQKLWRKKWYPSSKKVVSILN